MATRIEHRLVFDARRYNASPIPRFHRLDSTA
jgi:hypothetical protein